MRLTVTTADSGDVEVLNITPSTTMPDLARMIQERFSIPAAHQVLQFKGAPLPMTGSVTTHGIEDDDIVLVDRAGAEAGGGAEAGVGAVPRAGVGGGLPMPASQGSADMMSADVQRAIEERIRAENVAHNMEQALEHNPEAFGSVVMLFVNCEINGVAAKAFVDSGAQSTIISKECAERCNLLRLLDKRFAGTAVGVGTATIHGRIHVAPLRIESDFFHCSFQVLDSVGNDYDMLLGLDMLRKHAASIDLKDNVLRIGNAVAPFLAEKDIPKKLRTVTAPAPQGAQGGDAGGGGRRLGTAAEGGGAAVGGGGGSAANEDAVAQLVQLGFSREEATQALGATGGNADQAAALLAQSRYGF